MHDDLQRLKAHLEQLPPRYPERRAAIVDVMRLLQQKYGYLSDEAVCEAARITGLSATEVEELATFYSLIYRHPVGRHVLRICDSVCCAMQGANEQIEDICHRLGVEPGQIALDGKLTVLPNICLGLCDRAPAALLDGEAIAPVSTKTVDALLDQLRDES